MPEGTTTTRFGDARLPQRFWDKARVDPDGCWRWTAAKSCGYGKIGWNGKSVHAHLVAYRTLVGEIPAGLVADHECHQPDSCVGGIGCVHRSCVNPAHIGLKTNAENTSRGRMAHWNSRKSSCPVGHEFTPENTRTHDGKRYCRACAKVRSDDRKAARPSSPRTHCQNGHEYTPENTRTSGKSRQCKTCARAALNARRAAYREAHPPQPVTHCIHGHEFTPENTSRRANGTRKCRACERARKQAWRERSRA